ncbi:MAG: energy transducer TonB [Thermodesulfobacteriota bacterium]|nr:energy transducer TonB [Thermodesulfobacteriota bacterium]
MNRIKQRLLVAGLLALLLHGAALSWQLNHGRISLPAPLPIQRIEVSLGTTREVAGQRPPESKQVQQPKKKKDILPQAKAHKPSPALNSKPKTVARQTLQKKTQPQPKPAQQKSVVQPANPVKKTSVEHQPVLEPATTSPQTDIENENAQASAAARVIKQATPLYQINPPPQYPRLARRRNLEGVVLLEVLIAISGKVADLRLLNSSGHSVLDRAAQKAVRRWLFTPGTIDGRRHEMWVKVPVRFQLK